MWFVRSILVGGRWPASGEVVEHLREIEVGESTGEPEGFAAAPGGVR
jgi:hypothetical protein